jgi:transcription-repair coupling factor (superfamily II helicase)
MSETVSGIVTRLRRTGPVRELASRLLSGEPEVVAAPVPPTGAALAVAALAEGYAGWIVCVNPGWEEADEFLEDLAAFGAPSALAFPAFESSAEEPSAADERAVADRLNALQCLSARTPVRPTAGGNVFVTCPLALSQSVPAPDELSGAVLDVETGATRAVEQITGWLAENDFRPGPQVVYPGEYSLRGGILDVFSHGAGRPVRIEFFGDTIDSIREFDAESQISRERVDATRIIAPRQARPASVAAATLFDYLPPNALLVLVDPDGIRDRTELLRHAAEGDPLAVAPAIAPEAIESRFGAFQQLVFSRSAAPGLEAVDLGMDQPAAFGPDVESSLRDLVRLGEERERVVVFCRLEAERSRLLELLDDPESRPLRERLHFDIRPLNHALVLREPAVAFVPHHRLFHRYRQRRELAPVAGGRAIESFLELRPDDLVVHVQYGIGRFHGVSVLEKEGQNRDYLVIEFRDRSFLYVPSNQIELVQKYVGSTAAHPGLSSLHGKAWQNRRRRAEEAIEDLAGDLLALQAARAMMKGIAHPAVGPLERQFAAEFPYEETPDQIETIEKVAADLCRPRPMDRLICGDVGYGKTEIAMRAAFKAVAGGRQVGVLVPTTVLAQQHYDTFRERMADFPVNIEMLSRFCTAAETRRILTRLAEGKVDIVIGTHRLVQRDVMFRNLGLIVIDEEQRFGVEHKERLKRLRRSVDVLTLTATPIPRTLHMALTGIRDISSLHTPPQDRLSIETRVCVFDPARIRHAILRELRREGQAFFVHNRVFDIQGVADTVRAVVPEARVGVGHGQMPDGELEQAMRAFMDREIDVLVCTTIIENGLDIPSANTIFIHEADHFGLAELHQLRGRVGRYKHKAYAYLLVPQRRPVTPEAQRRLQAIREYSDLGAGFQIAIRDLEIRGAGNILGAEQSGHIAAIGYDLYCRLLDQAVRRARKEPPTEVPDVAVNLKLRALLPDHYVPVTAQKLALYRRICRARDLVGVRIIASELRDRFGPLPREAESLLLEAEVRVMAARCGVTAVTRVGGSIEFETPRISELVPLLDGSLATLRIVDENTFILRLPPTAREPEAAAEIVRKLLKRPYGAAKKEQESLPASSSETLH